MSNKITAIQAIEGAIDSLNAKLVQTDENLLKISKKARETYDSFKMIKAPKDVASKIKATEEATEQLNAQLKNQDKLERDLIMTIQKKVMATESTARAVAKEKFELNETNKRVREAAKLSSSLATEYQKQAIKLNQLIRIRQDLALKQQLGNKLTKEEQKQLRQLTKEIQKKDRALKTVDAQVGRYQRNVGNYTQAMKGAAGAARSMASALGYVGGAVLFGRVMLDAFNRVRQFDKEMQNMSGILRTNRKDLQDVEKEIVRVASISTKTSTEVAQLASSLFTLGKTRDEVKLLLEPVNNLSIALGATSDETGEFLVQTLNAFGAGADEASKYADTIAAIRTSTSLDFQKMADSFQYITPISKILNRDLAETGALIGVLADNGIKAESAGRLLATAEIKLAANGQSLQEVLEMVNKEYERGASGQELLAKTSEYVDAQAAKIIVTLATQTERLEEYTDKINAAGGSLDDLVNEQLKSVDAQLKITSSVWEEFILSIESGQGPISETFTGLLELTNQVLKGWTLLNKTTKEYNDYLREDVANQTFRDVSQAYAEMGDAAEATAIQEADAARDRVDSLQAEIKALEDRNKSLEESETGFQKVMRYGKEIATVGLATSKAAQEFRDNEKAIEELNASLGYYEGVLKASEAVIEQTDESQKELNKTNEEAAEVNTKTIAKLRELIKLERDNLEQIDLEADGAEELVKAKQKIIDKYQREIDALLGTNKARKKEKDAIKGTLAYYEKLINGFEEQQRTSAKTREEYKKLQERIDLLKEAIKALKEEASEGISVGAADGFDLETMAKDELKNMQNYVIGKGMKNLSETIGENVENLYSEYFERYGNDFTKFFEYIEGKLEGHTAKIESFKQEMITSSAAGMAASLGIQADALRDFLAGIIEGFEDTTEKVLTSIEVVGQLTTSILNKVYDAKIQRYEDDIERNREYYDRLLDNERLTDTQRDALQRARDRKEEMLERRKREAQRKAAIYNKVLSIAQVAIDTAQSVTKTAATLGYPAAIPFVALAIAQGAIQAGVIAATPIPRYAKGKGDFDSYEGPAIWGENKREIRFGRRGVELSPKYPGNHRTHVYADDVIHPDADKFLRDYHNLLRVNSINENHEKNAAGATVLINAGLMARSNRQDTDRLIKAMEKNKSGLKSITTINNLGDDLKFLARLNDVL